MDLLNFFFTFHKSTLNVTHFTKKDDPHGSYISEIKASEKRG